MSRVNRVVKSANQIHAYMDGNKVGLGQSIDANDDYAPEPASGIGDIHAQEYVPTMARHNISMTKLILRRGAFRDNGGVFLENGDIALKGFVFDFIIVDSETNQKLRKYESCSYASGSVSIQKHSIVVSNATFNALDVKGAGL